MAAKYALITCVEFQTSCGIAHLFGPIKRVLLDVNGVYGDAACDRYGPLLRLYTFIRHFCNVLPLVPRNGVGLQTRHTFINRFTIGVGADLHYGQIVSRFVNIGFLMMVLYFAENHLAWLEQLSK